MSSPFDVYETGLDDEITNTTLVRLDSHAMVFPLISYTSTNPSTLWKEDAQCGLYGGDLLSTTCTYDELPMLLPGLLLPQPSSSLIPTPIAAERIARDTLEGLVDPVPSWMKNIAVFGALAFVGTRYIFVSLPKQQWKTMVKIDRESAKGEAELSRYRPLSAEEVAHSVARKSVINELITLRKEHVKAVWACKAFFKLWSFGDDVETLQLAVYEEQKAAKAEAVEMRGG
ncbi:hypothetical protein C8R44DRAFT_765667 [Mycena epipterygia]|nr:hypothetical protein C8R44DRAFT_765667 [Mycena epipterygia]